jgi:pimeloyl-ACP methyl ester carboxylesterase
VGVYRGGSGPPLVLLHGVTSSWRAWRPVLPELERHHEVVALTLPGHVGGRPWDGGRAPSIDALVDEVGDQFDELGLDAPHVAGNSLGGWIALELARRGRARSVVALSPAGAWAVPRDMYRLQLLFRLGAHLTGWPAIRRLVTVGWVRRFLMLAVAEHAERYSPDDVDVLFEDLAGCTILEPMLARAHDDGPIRELDSPSCPVRIAWGGSDRMIPFRRYGRPMMDAVPDAELVVLPGVGHVPMVDDPSLVAWTILQVTRHSPANAEGA